MLLDFQQNYLYYVAVNSSRQRQLSFSVQKTLQYFIRLLMPFLQCDSVERCGNSNKNLRFPLLFAIMLCSTSADLQLKKNGCVNYFYIFHNVSALRSCSDSFSHNSSPRCTIKIGLHIVLKIEGQNLKAKSPYIAISSFNYNCHFFGITTR